MEIQIAVVIEENTEYYIVPFYELYPVTKTPICSNKS